MAIFESSKDSKKKILKSIIPRRNKAPLRALKNVHPISQANSRTILPKINVSMRRLTKINSQKP